MVDRFSLAFLVLGCGLPVSVPDMDAAPVDEGQPVDSAPLADSAVHVDAAAPPVPPCPPAGQVCTFGVDPDYCADDAGWVCNSDNVYNVGVCDKYPECVGREGEITGE